MTSLETVLSDFYKLTVSVVKAFFKKHVPKIITYLSYKYFSNDACQPDTMNELLSIGYYELRLDIGQTRKTLFKTFFRKNNCL